MKGKQREWRIENGECRKSRRKIGKGIWGDWGLNSGADQEVYPAGLSCKNPAG